MIYNKGWDVYSSNSNSVLELCSIVYLMHKKSILTFHQIYSQYLALHCLCSFQTKFFHFVCNFACFCLSSESHVGFPFIISRVPIDGSNYFVSYNNTSNIPGRSFYKLLEIKHMI